MNKKKTICGKTFFQVRCRECGELVWVRHTTANIAAANAKAYSCYTCLKVKNIGEGRGTSEKLSELRYDGDIN